LYPRDLGEAENPSQGGLARPDFGRAEMPRNRGGRIRTADLLLPNERGVANERVREDTGSAESPGNGPDQQFSFWSGDEPEE